MKSPLLVAVAAILAVSLLVPGHAPARSKEEETKVLRPVVSVPDELRAEGEALLESMGRPVQMASAAVDTYCIVWYDFETFDL